MTPAASPRRYAAVFPGGASLPADHEFTAYFDSGGDRYRRIVLGILARESYVHPLTILSTLPSAGVGALRRWNSSMPFQPNRPDRDAVVAL